jgi:hypothetical protein
MLQARLAMRRNAALPLVRVRERLSPGMLIGVPDTIRFLRC